MPLKKVTKPEHRSVSDTNSYVWNNPEESGKQTGGGQRPFRPQQSWNRLGHLEESWKAEKEDGFHSDFSEKPLKTGVKNLCRVK